MTTKKKWTATSVRFSAEQKKQLRLLAKKYGMSQRAVIGLALRELAREYGVTPSAYLLRWDP